MMAHNEQSGLVCKQLGARYSWVQLGTARYSWVQLGTAGRRIVHFGQSSVVQRLRCGSPAEIRAPKRRTSVAAGGTGGKAARWAASGGAV